MKIVAWLSSSLSSSSFQFDVPWRSKKHFNQWMNYEHHRCSRFQAVFAYGTFSDGEWLDVKLIEWNVLNIKTQVSSCKTHWNGFTLLFIWKRLIPKKTEQTRILNHDHDIQGLQGHCRKQEHEHEHRHGYGVVSNGWPAYKL